MRKSSILILALALSLCAAARAADLPMRFDPARDAATDVAQAIAMARADGKHVIVDVGGEWCSWCHILDRFIASHAELHALINSRYVWVKVNVSKENRNQAFLARWPRIEGYPHLFILDADGRLVHSQDTGVLESGKSYDEARFAAMLRRWSASGVTNRT